MIFYIECVCMFMIYLHAKFHVPGSKRLVFIAVNPKVKYNFLTVAMLLFYILPKKKTLTKVAILLLPVVRNQDVRH
jgi:hypothetical protein